MNRFVAALLALGVLGAVPVVAQESAPAVQAEPAQVPAEEPSPAELELANKLLDLTGSRRSYDALLPNIAERAKTTFIRANPQMQLGIIAVIDKVALELVDKRADLDRNLARVWAAAFTEDELTALVEFYESEPGKKFAVIQPRVLGVEMRQADNWARAISQELTRRVREEMKIAVDSETQSLTGAAPAGAAATPAEAPAQ